MKIDIVVLNLTRLGDLLQSQPLIEDLTLAGYKTGLVCLENFAPAAAMLRDVSALWTLPGARLMSSLDSDWRLALGQLGDFVKKITVEGAPRYCLNLTPSPPARLLSRMLANAGARSLGFGMDKFGFGENHGLWATFLSVAAQRRINAPFNLAEMLRGLADPLTGGRRKGGYALAPPNGEARAWAKNFLREHAGDNKPAGFVAFQPGASAEIRRWPLAHFHRLGQRLWDEARMLPVLLGSAQEKELAAGYGGGHPHINAVGATSLPQLAALLRECRFLTTNDTGTMHLAAGQGVPSLAFFLATAQPWDTGPLLPGCCCLEPALRCHPCAFNHKCEFDGKCRGFISPDAAADIALGWLKHGSWSAGLTPAALSQCRPWLTTNNGFASVAPLGELDNRGLWLSWLKIFWRQLLDDLGGGEASKRDYLAEARLDIPAGAAGAAKTLREAANLAPALKTCAELAAKSPQAATLLLRNSERFRAVLDSEPALATLSAFWVEISRSQNGGIMAFPPILDTLARNFNAFAARLAPV